MQKWRQIKLVYRVLICIASALAALAVGVTATYVGLRQSGRLRLANNATSEVPTLESDSEEGDSSEEQWQDDWIWYDGQIYEYNDSILTFLFMGIDVGDEVGEDQTGLSSGQADALFLLVLDQDARAIHVVAIDRNTMTEINRLDEDGTVLGTVTAQVAVAHGYGDGKELSAENTLSAVSNILYDIPIHGYCAINMAAISELNDAVGGVDVTVLESLPSTSGLLVEGETVHLEGEDAYVYVKVRDANVEGSAQRRLQRQKQYLIAYIQQAKAAVSQDFTLVSTLFTSITPYMTTDVTLDEVVYLASTALSYSFADEDMITIPGETVSTEGYSDEFYPDEDALKDLIIDVFYTPVETSSEDAGDQS
ncbi:MAG: LCP family protein [Clostridiales bacterium]|nr:LCP family protein [Clostridiales bacterium]